MNVLTAVTKKAIKIISVSFKSSESEDLGTNDCEVIEFDLSLCYTFYSIEISNFSSSSKSNLKTF